MNSYLSYFIIAITSKVDEVLKSGDPQGKQKLSTVKRMCEDIYKKL